MNLQLADDEAFILYDFLSRVIDRKLLSIEHEAETWVLSCILCDLESAGAAPMFDADYREQLEAVRTRLMSNGAELDAAPVGNPGDP